jgi:hypothetical protein
MTLPPDLALTQLAGASRGAREADPGFADCGHL